MHWLLQSSRGLCGHCSILTRNGSILIKSQFIPWRRHLHIRRHQNHHSILTPSSMLNLSTCTQEKFIYSTQYISMTILHTHTGVYEDTHTHTRANLLGCGGVRERVGDSGGDYRGSGAEGRLRGARWRGSRGRWLRRQQLLLKGERERGSLNTHKTTLHCLQKQQL